MTNATLVERTLLIVLFFCLLDIYLNCLAHAVCPELFAFVLLLFAGVTTFLSLTVCAARLLLLFWMKAPWLPGCPEMTTACPSAATA